MATILKDFLTTAEAFLVYASILIVPISAYRISSALHPKDKKTRGSPRAYASLTSVKDRLPKPH